MSTLNISSSNKKTIYLIMWILFLELSPCPRTSKLKYLACPQESETSGLVLPQHWLIYNH